MSLWHKHKQPKLFYTPSDSHQAGALLYTARLYSKDDSERSLPKWVQWLRIRDQWMTEQETIYGKGNLTCVICGRTGLNPWAQEQTPISHH